MKYLDDAPENKEGNEEPETNQDVWLSRRSRVIELMVAGGQDCRLYDALCTSEVTHSEEEGEEEWDEGLKYRKDVSDEQFPEGSPQRKELCKIKCVPQINWKGRK